MVPNLTFAHEFFGLREFFVPKKFGPCMKMPYNDFHAGPRIFGGPNEIRDHFSCSQTQELCFIDTVFPHIVSAETILF